MTKLFRVMAAAALLTGLLSACTADAPDPLTAAQDIREAEDVPAVDTAEPGEVTDAPGLTVQQFEERFNTKAAEVGAKMNLEPSTFSQGSIPNTFQYAITANLILTGTLNPADDSVRAASLLTQGDGSEATSAHFFTGMSLVMLTMDPSLDLDRVTEIADSLKMTEADADFSSINETTERSGLRYRIEGSKEGAVQFSVEIPLDN